MKSILLIDDEAPLREGIARFLRKSGFLVHEASDGEEARRVIEAEGEVDLVVTDINMPETDGLEVIRAIRKAGGRVPVIAISGGGLFSKSMLLQNAEYLGATATLAKPFRLDALGELVRDMVGGGPES